MLAVLATLCRAVVALCVLVSAFAQAQPSNPLAPADPFTGVFRHAQVQLELARDGSEYRGMLAVNGQRLPVTGRAEQGVLRGGFTVQGATFAFAVKTRPEGGLLLESDGATYVLERAAPVANPLASPSAPPAVPARGLTGVWRNAEMVIRIAPDGTAVIGGASYRYMIQGTTLTVTGNDGTFAMPFLVDGDNLTLSVGGRTSMFHRLGEEAEAKPNDLAGRWCAAVPQTGGDGKATVRACLTLTPDGKFVYAPESSTGPDERDAGTWSVTDNGLILRSRLQGVVNFKLERRTNPETQRQTLVINGLSYESAKP